MGINMKISDEVDLVIPMVHDIEIAATKTASAVAQFMQFDNDKIDELNQALIEACINAFEHSNSNDNKLYIKFVMDSNELTVIIKDNGKGFNPTRADEEQDIKDKFKSEYKRGWGLMLIKNLMDKVEIESDSSGTTLKMTKVK
jgi:serine/threonine-protein kinase RsbW